MKKGHCLCGQVGWSYSGESTWACYCHCDDCRRNCAAPVVAFIGVRIEDFQWTGSTPAVYESSPGVKRLFCSSCGSPMAFQAERYTGEIHLYAASLENPEDFKPDFHVHSREKLSWLSLQDDLPKHPHSQE